MKRKFWWLAMGACGMSPSPKPYALGDFEFDLEFTHYFGFRSKSERDELVSRSQASDAELAEWWPGFMERIKSGGVVYTSADRDTASEFLADVWGRPVPLAKLSLNGKGE